MILRCWTVKNYGECFICIKTYLDDVDVDVFGLIDSQFGEVGVPGRLRFTEYKINGEIIDKNTLGEGASTREVELTEPINMVVRAKLETDDGINKFRDSIIAPLRESFAELRERFNYTEKEFNFSKVSGLGAGKV